jgi:hypothetical protein
VTVLLDWSRAEHIKDFDREKMRLALRACRSEALAFVKAPWLGEVSWDFPTWRVQRRPFDWQTDQADVPVPAPLPCWLVDDRRQFDLLLRPPAAVVQR